METASFSENPLPNNNMTLAIIATVLGPCSPCCIGLILGIIAIVLSSQVKTKFERGNFAGANSSSLQFNFLICFWRNSCLSENIRDLYYYSITCFDL